MSRTARTRAILRIAPALPGLKVREFFIPSEDGSELHMFGVDGRHSRTLNATTLHAIHRFQYDSTGRVASITDERRHQRIDGMSPSG